MGKSMAERFLADGARAIVCARHAQPLLALAGRHPGRVLPLRLDVSDRRAVEDTLGSLPGKFAEVDVLVNNAGLALGLSPAHGADPDDWDRMLATNCSGLMHVTRCIVPGWSSEAEAR
jgi:3-hydroxy acid dehydrogenase/malonic semialdehyde reductase